GFGTQAMALMLAAVRDFGVARIYLETERPNAQARRLYERLGFVEEDSIWMSLDFRDGTNQQ
ncbi:MAG: GNAT family N-acetyltransferase, partial [Acidimicrobiia bacterium]